uniref:Uncharacterized protein n=1 Tax=Cryptosporidium parvum TaxID=5807 RepID=F0X5B0_CRYPV
MSLSWLKSTIWAPSSSISSSLSKLSFFTILGILLLLLSPPIPLQISVSKFSITAPFSDLFSLLAFIFSNFKLEVEFSTGE